MYLAWDAEMYGFGECHIPIYDNQNLQLIFDRLGYWLKHSDATDNVSPRVRAR